MNKAGQGIPLGANKVTVLRTTEVSEERAAEKLTEFVKDPQSVAHVSEDHTALLQTLSSAIQDK